MQSAKRWFRTEGKKGQVKKKTWEQDIIEGN